MTKNSLQDEVSEMEAPSEYSFENFTDYYSKGHSNYKKYAERIKKSLYYGTLPSTDRPSKTLTEILVEKFGSCCKQDELSQLNLYDASSISYDACITPCSVIVALLYLDRLRTQNPDYLAKSSSSQVFVVAMMVASKFLYDDGEEDEVYNDEWAVSAAMILADLNEAEKEFLFAIDWNLYVDIAKFLQGLSYVEAEVAQKEALSRGFFTYSDLVAISKVLPPIWSSLISIIGSALVVCTVGYTFSLTIVTAGVFLGQHMEQSLAQKLLPSITNTTGVTHVPQCGSDLENEMIDLDFKLEGDDTPIEDSVHFSTTNKLRIPFHALQALTAALLLASPIDKLSGTSSVPNQSLDSSWTSYSNSQLDFVETCSSSSHASIPFDIPNKFSLCTSAVPRYEPSSTFSRPSRLYQRSRKELLRKRSQIVNDHPNFLPREIPDETLNRYTPEDLKKECDVGSTHATRDSRDHVNELSRDESLLERLEFHLTTHTIYNRTYDEDTENGATTITKSSDFIRLYLDMFGKMSVAYSWVINGFIIT